MYDETINEAEVNQIYLFDLSFLNFKKKYIVKTKNIKPGSLLSGQIDKDLKVGDKNIIKDNNLR
tara:strand:+ start:304 stop:495 length:192 start_codon:yes stop_codon:yes gene_type:complete